MVNFKINHKTAFRKALLLTVCSFFSFNNAQAGKFKEIPIKGKEVYLQYDDDEGRRDYGFTIEIGNRDKFLQELENSIKAIFNKGYNITAVDFSNSDLTDTDLFDVFSKLKLYEIPHSNISNTHIENVSDEEIIDISQVDLLSLPKRQQFFLQKENINDDSDEEETKKFTSIKTRKVGKYKDMIKNRGKIYQDKEYDSD